MGSSPLMIIFEHVVVWWFPYVSFAMPLLNLIIIFSSIVLLRSPFGLGWKLRCSALLIDLLFLLCFRWCLVCVALRFVTCFMLLSFIQFTLFGWCLMHSVTAPKLSLFMEPKKKFFLLLICQVIYLLGSAYL